MLDIRLKYSRDVFNIHDVFIGDDSFKLSLQKM